MVNKVFKQVELLPDYPCGSPLSLKVTVNNHQLLMLKNCKVHTKWME